MTVDELAKVVAASVQVSEHNMNQLQQLSWQSTRLLLEAIQQVGTELHVLKLALLRGDTLTLADLDEAEQHLRAGWAVEQVVNPEVKRTMEELQRLQAEVERGFGLKEDPS